MRFFCKVIVGPFFFRKTGTGHMLCVEPPSTQIICTVRRYTHSKNKLYIYIYYIRIPHISYLCEKVALIMNKLVTYIFIILKNVVCIVKSFLKNYVYVYDFFKIIIFENSILWKYVFHKKICCVRFVFFIYCTFLPILTKFGQADSTGQTGVFL